MQPLVQGNSFGEMQRATLIAFVLFAYGVSRANPPEYLAATREPAESASEEASPIEESFLPLRGWRLAQHSTEPFLRDAILSLEPRFYYRHLDNANGVQEAFTGAAR